MLRDEGRRMRYEKRELRYERGGVRQKGVRGERLSINVEGRGGSDLDLDPDPDSWKILWIRNRQNDADPLDPDPQN